MARGKPRDRADAPRACRGTWHHRRAIRRRLITAPIVGPRTEAQWEDYVGALTYRFTAEDEALVDGLVPPGHPSTPGYNDPAFPLEGRTPPGSLVPKAGPRLERVGL